MATELFNINTFREKLRWPAITTSDNNQEFKGELHGKLAEEFLSKRFAKIEVIKDYFKENFSTDLYFKYFNMEFNKNLSLGTTQLKNLENRFDAFRILEIKQE